MDYKLLILLCGLGCAVALIVGFHLAMLEQTEAEEMWAKREAEEWAKRHRDKPLPPA